MSSSLQLFRRHLKQTRDLLWTLSGQAHTDPDFPLDRAAVMAEVAQAKSAIGRIQQMPGFGGPVGMEDEEQTGEVDDQGF